jgi:hypothetical protein
MAALRSALLTNPPKSEIPIVGFLIAAGANTEDTESGVSMEDIINQVIEECESGTEKAIQCENLLKLITAKKNGTEEEFYSEYQSFLEWVKETEPATLEQQRKEAEEGQLRMWNRMKWSEGHDY